MASEIIINSSSQETRVALLENGVVAEIYIERAQDRSIVGNIYKGRVVRILPGMQACFVDIGLEKAGFLYVTDVYEEFDEFEILPKEEERGEGVHSALCDIKNPRGVIDDRETHGHEGYEESLDDTV